MYNKGWGWGWIRSPLRWWSQISATVRARTISLCQCDLLQRRSFLGVLDILLLRFPWQAWHFLAFRCALQHVEIRFAWQAQYFCDIFRRCIAVFVVGTVLWTCLSLFFAVRAALLMCHVAYFFANRIGTRHARFGAPISLVSCWFSHGLRPYL